MEQPQSQRRGRAHTTSLQRHHRARPSLDSVHSAQLARPRPEPARLHTDAAVSDRSSVAPRPSQQRNEPRSPPDSGRSRPRRLSASSSPQTASPTTSLSPLPNGYFSPQPSSSGADARSPAFRRPPASHSSHGLETSRGPPIALISRGSYSLDIARHIEGKKPNRADYGLAQQQLLQLGLISPGGTPAKKKSGGRGSVPGSRSSSRSRDRTDQTGGGKETGRTMDSDELVSSSFDEQSGSELAAKDMERSRIGTTSRRRADIESESDPDRTSLSEDLFLNLAEDPQPAEEEEEKAQRKKSRATRSNQRQSLPANTYTPSTRPDSKGNDIARTPSQQHHRRASQIPPSLNTRLTLRDHSPMSAGSSEHRPRPSIQPSPSPYLTKYREHELQPALPQSSRRRLSNADSNYTPSNRSHGYKRSNLQYTSSHQDHVTEDETPPETMASREYLRTEGTESVDSGPAPSAVWDEVDNLKSRIRELELKQNPAHSAAAVSNASNERPRTATTTVTTISSSPKQRRKAQSPSDPAPEVFTTLNDALARCKETLSPIVYRALEATATESLALASASGSSGPQGTTFTVASIINGATAPDRQVRRRAHNICQSLTELCVALCEGKVTPASPFRQLNQDSRRSSMQFSNEGQYTPAFSSHARSESTEPDAAGVVRSPSRALSRVEARRTSLMHNGLDRGSRHASEEPTTPSMGRFTRTGTSLTNARHNLRESPVPQYDDDEEPTVRVPSRAMTEYAVHLRPQPSTAPRHHRNSREYTSQEPMPHFQSSPLTQTPSVRRQYGNEPATQSYLANATSSLRENGTRKYYERGAQQNIAFERDERNGGYRSEERRRLTQPGGGRYDNDRRESPLTGLNRTGSLNSRRAANGANGRRFGTTTNSSVNSSVD